MIRRLRKHQSRPADLTAPGAITRLLTAHALTYGATRMQDDDDKDDDTDGDGDGDDKDDDDGSGDGDDKADTDKPLGPKGEKAYEAEKTKRRAAQQQLREWKDLGLTPAEVKQLLAALPDDKDGKTPDRDAIRAELRAEVDVERNRERVLDKIEARAARAFADPDDAAVLLMRDHKPEDFLDENGKVDVDEVEDALTNLLEKKPHLAAQGGKRFKGSGDGGPRKEAPKKALTLQDAVAARLAGGKT